MLSLVITISKKKSVMARPPAYPLLYLVTPARPDPYFCPVDLPLPHPFARVARSRVAASVFIKKNVRPVRTSAYRVRQCDAVIHEFFLRKPTRGVVGLTAQRGALPHFAEARRVYIRQVVVSCPYTAPGQRNGRMMFKRSRTRS